ncbi:hypothetical protein CN311_23460 [Mesorhizobium sanjuanii]|uniref:Uncharacterized protein n=1 Tax=Mesorhizobium sanjuanii TaxID=2037900 RepID=A0A2A6F9Q0_9HYPH|nr:hypothetical protein [Mesorhizobium sanjuanii]PDQ18667.1 hypothetical protein CN311_23460 [Mesorhizobium sanjuanii]
MNHIISYAAHTMVSTIGGGAFGALTITAILGREAAWRRQASSASPFDDAMIRCIADAMNWQRENKPE